MTKDLPPEYSAGGVGWGLLNVLQPLASAVVRGKPPTQLFHYTSVEGLQGILESGELVATNLRFMNDRTELVYGIEVLSEVLQQERAKFTPSSREANLLKRCVEILDFYSAGSGELPPMEYYGLCFCEADDSLGQWRAYARDGIGYALGFSGATLAKNPFEGTGILVKVIYDRAEQEKLVRTLVEALIGYVNAARERLSPADKTRLHRRAIITFGASTALLVMSFKHPSFAVEQEWRYVQSVRPEEVNRIRFRSRGGSLVPSIRLIPAPEVGLPLQSIVHGPGVQQATSVHGLRLFLEKRGLGDRVSVRKSSIPLTGPAGG